MKWTLDSSHSEINFSVRHMMISNVRGRFEKFDVEMTLDPDNAAASQVVATIDASSINTKDEKRDAHLRSPDFLNADAFPALIFKSRRVERVGSQNARVTGDLTIRDITREVVLDVEYNGMSKSPWGTTSAGFSATTKINRKDWDLTWNVALESGGILVGEEVKIAIDIELVQVPEPVAEQTPAPVSVA
jgi:polyisoprenoid-binding protein YceI